MPLVQAWEALPWVHRGQPDVLGYLSSSPVQGNALNPWKLKQEAQAWRRLAWGEGVGGVDLLLGQGQAQRKVL